MTEEQAAYRTVGADGEASQLSDLEEGAGDFSGHADPFGEVAVSRADYSKVLDVRGGRIVGRRSYYQYRGLCVDPVGSMVSKKVEALVTQFGVDAAIRRSVVEDAERIAARLVRSKRMGTDKASIVAVALEFARRGRTAKDISTRMAGVYSYLARTADFELAVVAKNPRRVKVRVGEGDRKFKIRPDGMVWRVVLPVYAGDNGSLLSLSGVKVVRNGFDTQRGKLIDSRTIRLVVREKNYELFKLVKEALVDVGLVFGHGYAMKPLGRYSLGKLPSTSNLLKAVGCYPGFERAFYETLSAKLKDGNGKTPKVLAIEALNETEKAFLGCMPVAQRLYAQVWAYTNLSVDDARRVGDGSLLHAESELAAWED